MSMDRTTTLPALLGGPPVRPQGPPDWPLPDDDVRVALLAAYADGSWGKYHGGAVERLPGFIRHLFFLGEKSVSILNSRGQVFGEDPAVLAKKTGMKTATDPPFYFSRLRGIQRVLAFPDQGITSATKETLPGFRRQLLE